MNTNLSEHAIKPPVGEPIHLYMITMLHIAGYSAHLPGYVPPALYSKEKG